MSLKPSKLWALVTDSGCGRLFELERSPRRIENILSREAAERRRQDHQIRTDAAGRDYNTSGPGSHSKQPRTDAHEDAERQFVKEWVDGLQGALLKGRFEHLILVADPTTLGRLREKMNKPLKEAVIAEDDRDLTKLKQDDLEPELRELAGWPA